MDDTNFRDQAKQDIDKLLTYWREIERWVKISEQVNKRVVIPAINELRYAARQLLIAISILQKLKLSAGDKSSIRKRIIIAEQYFFNADHDASDGIVGFYSKIVAEIDADIGISEVSLIFPGYPKFRKELLEVNAQISGSRFSLEDRDGIYGTMKKTIREELIPSHQTLVDSEVQARFSREKMNYEFQILKEREKIRNRLNYLFGGVTVLSLILTIIVSWAQIRTWF